MSAAWGGPGRRRRGVGGRRRTLRGLGGLGGLAGRLLRAWARLAGRRGDRGSRRRRPQPEDDEGGFESAGRRETTRGCGAGAAGSGARPPGAQGLRNHGNTCFMNAVVQCLSNTAPLAEFLALGRYRARGARAEVTHRLAALVRALWSLEYTPRLSAEFQSIVAKHGAQFRGNAQHDALEFLLWLLDRMHEDLGSASPAPGHRAAHQRSVEQSGASGESFVQSHFQAQYRSSLTCPHCRKQSNTFDPFLCISLPIPVRQTRALNVTLVLQREGGRSLRVGLAVPLLGTAAELREMVAREGDVPPQQVILAEVSPQGFLRSLDDAEELSTAGQEAPLYALQAPPEAPAGARPVLLLLCHVAGTGPHRARFGSPLVLWAERGASWAQLQRDVLAQLRGMMRSAVQGTVPLFRIHVARDPSAYLSPQDPHPLCHAAIDRALQQSPAGGPPHVALTVDWDIGTKERLFGSVQQEVVQDADSVRLQQAAHQQHSCTLDECFQLYTKEEQLAPDDAWRCPHCRVLQQGTVQLRLWTLPDILIIHLKRFRQVAQRRHKLSTLVRFPLRGLDMAPHLAPGGGRWQNSLRPTRSCPPDALYDLYAVCNHHGSMQGGHYTAYCCNSLDGRWYSYDDSTVEGVREDEVSTRSAYILFYQRRNAIPAWSASSAARGSSSSAPLNHWAARLGGTKQQSAGSQPAAPRPSPPCSPDLSTTQEQGGFEARPPVRVVQSRSLSVKLPPPARCRAPPRAAPLRWSFTSRPRAAPGQLLPYIPMGPVGGGSPRVEQKAVLGDAAGSTQSTEPPRCTPTPRRAHSAGPTGISCPKSPPWSGEQETGRPRVRQQGTPRAQHDPHSPDGPIRRSQSSACLPPRPPHPMRRSASLGRGAGGTAGIRGRERTATLRHGAVPESSF
ncbi:ubiquitin carboxyl-terminal hydrolase 43 [Tympanuchus pallidicinctus]|uniref:ubiquitin carboxyl-terminal hydrolase 43 n=1 Tax=Tympanuchus pallidicinctus TaxID=109042 RepID=UPI0022871E1B|nr:ubiquitin carboxyl-terminal hydrolase 43 [Tympanuchus pallidicinctus]